MIRLVKVAVLCAIIAAALLGLLWVTDVIPGAQLASVTGKTFAALGIIFGAAFAWRAVRGRSGIHDASDQPVP